MDSSSPAYVGGDPHTPAKLAERSSLRCGRSAPRGSRFSFRLAALLITANAVLVPAIPGAAEPPPSIPELKTQAAKLNDRLEILTEQYNGLRVRLDGARVAARQAERQAGAHRAALGEIRDRIRQIAARTYMSGGIDQTTAAFAAGGDPQEALDQAATLGYLSRQDSGHIKILADTTRAAEQASRTKEARLTEIGDLTGQIEKKKDRIESLLAANKDKLAAAVKIQHREEARERAAAEARERAEQQREQATASPSPPATGGSGGASAKALGALRAAKSKLGAPYVWGADGPDSFDCSGLTMWAYKQVAITLPHYTGDQWNSGRHVSRSDLRPGDLVFFYSDLHHMGMYVGNNTMIHAPHTGDVVRYASLDGRPYAGAVRVA